MDDEHVEPFIICQMIQRFGDWVAESLWEEVEPEEVMPEPSELNGQVSPLECL